MLCREIIAVCSEIHTKHINTLCGQNVEFVHVKPGDLYIDIQSVPRGKHIPSPLLKTSQLMLYREIIAVYSEIRKNHRNTLFRRDFWMLNLALHEVITGPQRVKLCW
jgi:hypothetical protein